MRRDSKHIYRSIHIQTAKIVNDMFAETGDVKSMSKEYHGMYIMGVILTQYSLNKELKVFGEEGEKAIVKELTDL